MKEVEKGILRVLKIIVGAIAVLALLGFIGYYISMGLNWLTIVIMDFISKSVEYLKGNWLAVIIIIIELIIGGLVVETIYTAVKNRKK